jgi:hypothetical protein
LGHLTIPTISHSPREQRYRKQVYPGILTPENGGQQDSVGLARAMGSVGSFVSVFPLSPLIRSTKYIRNPTKPYCSIVVLFVAGTV